MLRHIHIETALSVNHTVIACVESRVVLPSLLYVGADTMPCRVI
jgi:hypothetical protein